jgi:peptidylprolyl isomerase
MSTDCPAADGSSARMTSFSGPPPMCIDPSKTYTAQMATSLGTLEIDLDAAKAPNTVNNFVFLARYHYYDGLVFHRIIKGFMCQGGCPEGSGRGGPGYKFSDELPAAGDYKVGSLAMANAGPNTNGSQFFIVTGESGVGLPPDYALFGQVSAGLDVAETMQTVSTAPGDRPNDDVVIESITITES